MQLVRRLSCVASLALVSVACSGGAGPTSSAPPTAVAEAVPTSVVTAVLEPATPSPLATLGTSALAPALGGLVDTDGSAFDLSAFAGTDTLLFFGYTHCPDVCPATIGELFGVFQALPETQAVFVSVDPERDTPEFMAEWAQYFPENFHAVTGSPAAIRRAADEYGARYARVETSSQAGYTMSHTADLYLIDAEGQLATTYPSGPPRPRSSRT